MKLIDKSIIFLYAVYYLTGMPSFARIDGMIAENYFYDTDKTIMTEIIADKIITTGKYWEKNLFYFNKYRPLFMLSNKELYNLKPKTKENLIHTITVPSVYNISLKSSSVKQIQLSAKSQPESVTAVIKNEPLKVSDEKLIAAYELLKNPYAEPEKKISAAVLLKDSKINSNYNLAINLLDDVIKQEPYNAYAFYLKGEIYSQIKDFNKAMINYVEALKINPMSKQCYLGIAKALETTNKNLAQKYYDRAKLCEK